MGCNTINVNISDSDNLPCGPGFESILIDLIISSITSNSSYLILFCVTKNGIYLPES